MRPRSKRNSERSRRRRGHPQHLNDPIFYEKMSTLLDEIIAARKAKAVDYEAYLKRIAELVEKGEAGKEDDTPETMNTPGKRALYNNLRPQPPFGALSEVGELTASPDDGPRDDALALALRIDEAIRLVRPEGWRGIQAREQVIKRALYEHLMVESEVERIFRIIKAQREY